LVLTLLKHTVCQQLLYRLYQILRLLRANPTGE
jgi:hypothetical protein